MQIAKIQNGWLVFQAGVQNMQAMTYFPTLAAIDEAMQSANSAAANDAPPAPPRPVEQSAPPAKTAEVADIKTRRSRKPATPPAAVESAKKPGPTLDDVRAAMNALNHKHGLDLCMQALSRVGAARASDIKFESYQTFIDVATAALESGRV